MGMRVAYTDPVWALDGGGKVDVSLADVESTIYGNDIEVDLGVRDGGRWIISGDGLNEYVAGADALVVYRAQVTAELLEAIGPTCKVVARQGVGLDNLNIPLLKAAGLYGFHVPDYCGDEVSSHALALLLALERGVCVQDRLVRSGNWGIHAGGVPRRTAERTVAIVGFGRIGRATSRKVGAFYDSVLAYDPYVPGDLMASFGVRKVDSLGELLAAADAVLLHADLNAETESMIDAAALAVARPDALLVNTARGKLVDPGAVLAALESGGLGGFASDVFSPEDPNDDPVAVRLLERDDVIVSSHRAFLSAESERSLRRRIAEGVAHVLRSGAPPELGRVA
jgi:phosphoglycerate dehydrogenase-like enzyme